MTYNRTLAVQNSIMPNFDYLKNQSQLIVKLFWDMGWGKAAPSRIRVRDTKMVK